MSPRSASGHPASGHTASSHPVPSEVEAELRNLIRHWHRLRWLSVGALSAVLVAAAVLGAVAVAGQGARLAASCAFYHDIGAAPLVVPAGATRPSLLGVSIVIDARRAFAGQHCPALLAPPSPGLVRWARFYRLPVAD